jgi:hypothetical protein
MVFRFYHFEFINHIGDIKFRMLTLSQSLKGKFEFTGPNQILEFILYSSK